MTEKTQYTINVIWDCTQGWQDSDSQWKPWVETTLDGIDAEFFKTLYNTEQVQFNCNDHGLKVTGWNSWQEALKDYTAKNDVVIVVNHCGLYRGCDAYSRYVIENGTSSYKETGPNFKPVYDEVDQADPDYDNEEEYIN